MVAAAPASTDGAPTVPESALDAALESKVDSLLMEPLACVERTGVAIFAASRLMRTL